MTTAVVHRCAAEPLGYQGKLLCSEALVVARPPRLGHSLLWGRTTGAGMRVLETGRLGLRPLNGRDEELYCRIYTDPELMRHVGVPLTREAALSGFGKVCRFNQDVEFRYRCWVMQYQRSGQDIGLLALMGNQESAEIGAMILAEWHGRGFATEAIGCLVDFAFGEYGVGEVYTRHRAENGLADGLMHKLNFVRVPSEPQDQGRVRWSQKFAQWSVV